MVLHWKYLKEKTKNILMDMPALSLALRAKETPWIAKLFAALTLLYALSPVDLIPDFIPILGYLDDILILPLLILLTCRLIPKDVMAKFREEAKDIWSGGKPQKWYYAIPIVLIWVLFLAWLISKLFFSSRK